MIHWLLEHHYQGNSPEVSDWIEYRRSLSRKDADKFNPKKASQDQANLIAVGEILFDVYKWTWKPTDRKIKWKGLEVEFTQPFEYAPGEWVLLRGKRDGLFQWRRRGPEGKRLYTFETKTISQDKGSAKMRQLEFDFQNLFYLTATEDEVAARCWGTYYNLIRKPGSKQKVNETPEEYRDRMRKEIEKKPTYYTHRYECAYSLRQTRVFRKHLAALLTEFVPWVRNGCSPAIPNSSVCLTMGQCTYLDACASGKPRGYVTRNRVHPELSED